GLDHLVEFAFLVGVLDRVGEARAAARAHADADAGRRLAAPGQQGLDALRRRIRHGHRLFPRHDAQAPRSARYHRPQGAGKRKPLYVALAAALVTPPEISRLTAAAIASTAKSTSAAVVKRPRPMRIEAAASASGSPRARST